MLISPIASNIAATQVLSLILAYLSLILVSLLTEAHFGRGGFRSATLLAFVPSMVIRGDVITMNMLLLTLSVLALLFMEQRRQWAVFITCALGINAKYPFGIVLLPLATIGKSVLLGSIIVMALALLPFGKWSYIRTGDFLMLQAWLKSSPAWYTYYRTPWRRFILLLLITCVDLLRKRRNVRMELPFLLLVAGNLIQF